MTHLPTSLLETRPLQAFGWGLGLHCDSGPEPAEPDAPAIALLRDMGVAHYRLNVRWNRIAPTASGPTDDHALDQVGETVELLLGSGIEPLVALDNAAIPHDLEADGGWRNQSTAHAYGDFAGAVGARLGHLVTEWLPLATPRPAGFHRSMALVLLEAHSTASRILRAHCPDGSIGVAVDLGQLTADDAAGNAALLDYLTANAADFTVINVDDIIGRSPSLIGDVIRMLHRLTATPSFTLTETLSSMAHRREALRHLDHTIDSGGQPVSQLLTEVQRLRSEQINVSRAFSWPVACVGAVPNEAFTPDAFAEYQRMVSIGVS